MLEQYVEYDKITGKITKTGSCSSKQLDDKIKGLTSDKGIIITPVKNKGVVKLSGNDLTLKVVNNKIVGKTLAEIEADKPPGPKRKPLEERQAVITNKQLQNMLKRIDDLEKA